VIANTPLEILQARQAAAALDANAGNLNSAAAAATMEFRRKMLGNGMGLGFPRNARAGQMAEATLGDILGAFYVARFASADARARVQQMAAKLVRAFDARLAHVSWMSPGDRVRARKKLARIRINVGHPEAFDDYAGLEIRDDDLFGNVARAAEYSWRRKLRRLGTPFDYTEWELTPEYPNYNYRISTNAVEIPAALLEAPFFDPKADDAVNYGAVGGLIGQMIVTGFSGRGIGYDSDGHLAPLLSAADTLRLAALMKRLGAQYSTVEPLPGLHIKGDLVVDEAVGDLGGLQIALDAYHASLGGRPAPVLDGYSGDQRFFLSRAQMWRAKFPPAFVRNQIATGLNSPPFMRVNGPVVHMDAWYEAFGVQAGDRMFVVPPDRVRIW